MGTASHLQYSVTWFMGRTHVLQRFFADSA
jgi:hypothetical protein